MGDALSRVLQQHIAHVVTQRVVQRLEIVEIDEEQGAVGFVADIGIERLAHAVDQQDAVSGGLSAGRKKASSWIFSSACFEFRNIIIRTDVIGDFARLVFHGGYGQPARAIFSALGPQTYFTLPATINLNGIPHGVVELGISPMGPETVSLFVPPILRSYSRSSQRRRGWHSGLRLWYR